ncbi:Putative E3 ubiquitin-protein ligase LIN [Seminavis robusta]|uniref:E3 ubiquitin-protein ligase LIN n=1 Tax=Seminavis robusta TaxID=568900 RepID=A0A9N8DIT7_9STRA|nr:Putative E3 ubiquitin-protein ligase LIN [Seminavis robusta]|eukprot:Sro181_g079090.1 Putative E3 ubiquitin-protein ligase LIN (97) ;mRNA; r:47955-48245
MDHQIFLSPPEHFICPLTLEVMSDPVMHKQTGQIYDKLAIMRWIRQCGKNATCPLTRQPITTSDLVGNGVLRLEIMAWKDLQYVDELEAKLVMITS